MSNLIMATNNANKVAEVKAKLQNLPLQIQSLYDAGIQANIAETGKTLKENAKIKAEYIWKYYNVDCFADDTGLEVEALRGAPGVFSARYAGKKATAEENMTKLLEELVGTPIRTARFVTVICLFLQGKKYMFEGVLNGQITPNKKGDNGFGYDPIFLPDGSQKTLAELTKAEKNKISHRALALNKLVAHIIKAP